MQIKRFIPTIFILLVCSALSGSCTGKGNSDNLPEPYIQSAYSEYGQNMMAAGETVTLKGLNFSPVASDNVVLYGVGLDAASIPVFESSDDYVLFTAPKLSKEQLTVRVSTKGKESNSVVLVYTAGFEPLDGATTVTIKPGVEWTTFHGMWEGQVRNINIIKTTLNEHNSLGIYFNYSHSGLDNLDEKCEYLGAVTGTNGPMACCQFVRVDGDVKHDATEADAWICDCALTIDDNVVDIVKVQDNYKAKKLPNKTVGCAGPLLVWEGKIQSRTEEKTEDFLKTTHPRTAIGLSRDGKTVIQVAVDGRYTTSNTAKRAIGMSTPLLAKLMRGLGCYKAMNFDGGGGTAMWVYGQGDHGIVNHPCENKNWDEPWKSLRATGNAVYIKSDL